MTQYGCSGWGDERCDTSRSPLLHLSRTQTCSDLEWFQGLLDDSIYEISWLGVGTNRTLPDFDLGAVPEVPGAPHTSLTRDRWLQTIPFAAYLVRRQKVLPDVPYPMVHIPATISDNVPMTEISLGSDTNLNALVDAYDSIKQSASASRNGVFVVETQRRISGYIATMGTLAASLSFT